MSDGKRKRFQRRRPAPDFRLETLESRLLFSADAALLAADTGPHEAANVAVITSDVEISSDVNTEGAESGSNAKPTDSNELIVVDAAAPDLDALLADFSVRHDKPRVVLLEAGGDVLQQLGTLLSESKDLSAVHLFSHGSDGELQLGGQRITTLDLLARANEISGWRGAFADGADFLIYGCDVASSADGRVFVDTLARLTQTDVAASTDLTGSAVRGGDWRLEYARGEITTDVVASDQLQMSYDGTLATYVVTDYGDTGANTLRWAIEQVNAGSGSDIITFSGAGGTISLASELPAIVRTVEIDATVGNDYINQPIVTIDGSSGLGTGLRFEAGSDNSTVRGLAIINMPTHGISLDGVTGVTIELNYIGTDGTTDQGNGGDGIHVSGSAQSNNIGGANTGNVISGNGQSGVHVTGNGTDGNSILGNTIGLNATGTAAIQNDSSGILIESDAKNTIVGSSLAGAGNVVSGNADDGIDLSGSGVTGTVVQGNIVGLYADGLTRFANSNDEGVQIVNGANNNLIGGDAAAGEGNVISGNDDVGLAILFGSDQNRVMGNIIGLDKDGVNDLGNDNEGIRIANSSDENIIGGTNEGDGNIVSGNGDYGITIDGVADTQVLGNIIRDNSAAGIAVTGSTSTGNALLLNVITGNAGLGIDLGADGVTANDGSEDSDGGPNRLQNYPVLTTALADGSGSVLIEGNFESIDNSDYRLDFYYSTTGDGSGYGQAQYYIGTSTASTPANGQTTFSETFSAPLLRGGDAVTATLTRLDGLGDPLETSEFAKNLLASPMITAPVSITTDEDTTFVYSGANVVQVKDESPSDTRLQLSLSVGNGVLSLAALTGITFVSGSNGSASMVIDGLESDINTALDGLQFTPDADFNGADVLTISSAIEIVSDLLAYYPFEGNVLDQSTGTAYDGTLVGGTIVNTAERGNVLDLDGFNDYVLIPGLLDEPANVTLSAWINTTSTDTSGAVVISMGLSPVLYLQTNGRITGEYEGGGGLHRVSSSNSVFGTGWTHVALTIDTASQELIVYVDGSAIGTTAAPSAIDYDNSPDTYIGREGNGGTSYDFNGQIDDARVYARALSADEIAALASDQYPESDTSAIVVNAINDAPVLDNSGTPVFTTINEDDINNSGQTIASILATAGNPITDIEGDPEGIAIINIDYSDHNGGFEYSIDSGTTWNEIGQLNATGSLLLRDTDLIRFVPKGYGAESATIEFRAWDQTTGTAGSLVSTASRGGTTSFSAASETASITTTSINDAPVFGVQPGMVVEDTGGADSAYDVKVLSDGSVMAISAGQQNGSTAWILTKYTSSGVLDTSFGSGGYVITEFGAGGDAPAAMQVQSDGKIVIGGYTQGTSDDDYAVVRYNVDGTLDSGFGSSGIFTVDRGSSDEAVDIAIQSTGDILILGTESSNVVVLRLDGTNGTLDSSFGSSGVAVIDLGANEFGRAIAVDSSDRILIAGGRGLNAFVARLTSAGALDTTFDTDGYVTTTLGGFVSYGYSVLEQSDGMIVVGGYSSLLFVSNPADGMAHGLARFTSTGALDTGFSGDGIVRTTFSGAQNLGSAVNDIVQQPDGKLVAVGYVVFSDRGDEDWVVTRYNTDGSLDTSFAGNGILVPDLGNISGVPHGVDIDTDGSLLIAGSWKSPDLTDSAIAKISSSGSLVSTFQSGRLDATPTYVEGGTAIVIDEDVVIFDKELSGNDFDGASVTLSRDGGANAQDVFSESGLLGALTESGSLVYDGVTIGTVTTNSGGTLRLDLSASAENFSINRVLRSIAYSNTSNTPPATVTIDWTFNDGNTGSQGSGGALSATGSTTISVTSVNDSPTFGSSLDGTPIFVEGGAAVLLDTNVDVVDPELDALNSGNGNYANATLTIGRNGGLNSDDVFSFSNGNGIELTGGSLTKSSQVIASFSTVTPGRLSIVLTDSNLIPTSADVDNILHQITYSNTSETPPGSVQLDIELDDGNVGGQGTGGAEQIIGSKLVSIQEAPDFLVTAPAATATDEDVAETFVYPGANAVQVSDGVSADAPLRVSLSVANGTLALSTLSGITFVEGTNDSASIVIEGLESSVNTALDDLEFTPDENYHGGDTLSVEVSLAANLQGFYTFELDVEDQSAGTANNGTLVGDAAYVDDGQRGNVLDLDGSGDRVTLSPALTFSDQVTLSAWVNFSEFFWPDRFVVSLSNDVWISVLPSGVVEGSYRESAGSTWSRTTGSEDIADTGWRHITYTIDSSADVQRIYVDGILDRETNYTNANFQTSGNYVIGGNSTAGQNEFNGLIDDVRVYNRALSVTEIAGLATDQYSAVDSTIITINSVNDTPVFTSSSSESPTYIHRHVAVLLDPNLSVSDVDLDSLNSGTGNYTGAELTVVRDGGANSDDVFSFVDGNGISLVGSNLIKSSEVIANFDTTTTSGELVLTFTENNGVSPNSVDVDNILRQLNYANTNVAPPASVQITKSLNDGNTGSQGSGVAAEASTTITVLIQQSPDLLVTAPATATTDEDLGFTFVHPGTNSVQVTDGLSSDSQLQVSLSVSNGNLVLSGVSGITFVEGADNSASMVINGLESAINAALDGLEFVPDQDYAGSDTLTISVALAADLQGHYTFENNALDQSAGSAQDGTLSGGASFVSDIDRGNVLSLDGVDGLVEIAGLYGNPSNVTLASWVNLTASDSNGAEVISLGNNLHLRADDPTGGNGVTIVHYHGSNWTTTASNINIAGAGWTHLAATFDDDNDEVILYINGQVVATRSTTDSIVYSNGSNTTIGRHGDGDATRDFNGLIDDARVYSRALSAEEIAGLATDQFSDSDSVAITVSSINDAPVLDNSSNLALTTQAEDAGAPSGVVGTVITDLVSLGGNVTDVDTGSQIGVAITAADTTNGVWWYTIDNGTNWSSLGNVSDASARVLNANSNTRVYFQSDTDFNGSISDAITFRAWDRSAGASGSLQDTSSNGGSTAFSSVSETADLVISAVNDFPQLVGASIVTNGDFSSGTSGWTATGNVDDDGSRARFGQIGGVNGTLSQTLSTQIGATYVVSFDYGDGSETRSQSIDISVTGAATLLSQSITSGVAENTLQSYQYKFVADSTTSTITFTDTSADHSGVRGYLDNVKVATDATPNAALSYSENDTALVIDSTIDIVDIDNANVNSAIVQITGNFVSGQDVLTFVNQNGITGTFNSSSGALSLSESALQADYETALRSITYSNTSEMPDTSTRTISFTVNDGSGNSNTQTREIGITAVNDAPTATNLNAAESYTEDTALNLTDIVVSDLDSALVTVTLTLSDTAAGTLSTATSNAVTSTFASGVWSASGAIADVNTLLAGVAFTPADHYNSNFSIATSVSDGVAPALTGSKAFTGTAVNDAPTATNLNAAESYTEDTALNLTDIVISDVDSASVTVTLTLSDAAAGALSTATSNAVTSTFASGVWSASGAIADVNTLLAGVTFNPADHYNSNFSIAPSVSDGAAPAITGSKAISGTAVNDAPVNTVPGPQSVNEDTSISINGISVNDVDGNLATTQLTVTSGDLTVDLTGGASITGGADDSSTLTLSGTHTQINAALATLSYQGDLNFNGSDTLTVLSTDSDGTPLTDNDDITITVTPTNDAPTIGSALNNGIALTGDQVASGSVTGTLHIIDSPQLQSGSPDAGGSGPDWTYDENDGFLPGNFGAAHLRGSWEADGTEYDQSWFMRFNTGTTSYTFDLPDGAVIHNVYTTWAARGASGATYAYDDGVGGSDLILISHFNNTPENDISLNWIDADSVTRTSAFESIFSVPYTVDGGNGFTLTAVRSGNSHQTDAVIIDYSMPDNTTDYAAPADGDESIVLDETDTTLTRNGVFTVRDADGSDSVTASVLSVSESGVTAGLDSDNAALLAMLSLTNPNVLDGTVYHDLLEYTFDSGVESFEYLAAGDTLTLTYMVEVDDGNGGVDTADVGVSIRGTNDAPVVTTDTGALAYTENAGAVAVSSGLTVSDADTPDLTGATVQITGNYVDGEDELAFATLGSISGNFVQGTGTLTLFGNASVADYQTALRTITYENTSENPNTGTRTVSFTVNDGATANNLSTTASRDIAVSAVDDPAVVSGTVIGTVIEGDVADSAETVTGTISISDPDGSPSFVDVGATAGDNSFGSFTLVSGTWTYTLDQSAVQNLDAGDSATDTITYTATDSTTQQITITITGTDDAAVVAGTVVGAVTEGDIGDAAETATGSLSISDVDGDDTPSFADVVATAGDNNYGTFVLSSGTWTYTLDQSAVQNLDAGDSATDTITYTATDSTTQQITITITGTDDAAVVAGTVVGAVTEGDIGDAAVTATGSLSISDVDGDDTPSFADVVATAGDNNYGSFVLSSGTWTYTLDQSAVQDLDAGDSVTDTITYTASDGTSQQVTVTIAGSNDASVITGTTTGAVTEGNVGDAAETASGTLSVSDVDDDDNPGFADVAATAGDNAYGSFVLSGGTWTYTLDQSAVQDLDAGDSVTDTITFTASDGTSQQVTVTIAGSNDASVITGTTTGAVTEGNVGDAAETASGTLSVSDVDDDDSPSFVDVAATAGDNAYGSFVLSGGTWTYTLDQSAVQDLDAGDSVTDTITFTASDGTSQQVTVTIAGSNDTSVITGATTGAVTEGNVGDAAETASGTLSVSDVDDDDDPGFADVAATAGDNAYGFFVLTSGNWTYTLDQSAVQELDAGEIVTDTITYTATDSTTQQITITITGTDDAAIVAGTVVGAVTEGDIGDAAVTATGSLSISDVDGDDTPSFADVVATAGDNNYGSFVLSSGTWTYTLDQSAVQDLDAGDSATDTITYTASDSTTQQITITITGTDDAAVVAGTVVGAVTEGNVGDAAETATGTLSISDVDGDDTPSFADVVATAGDNNYGSFVLSSGTWTYTLDQSAVQDLDAGDSVTDTITYTASDGTSQQVTVTIAGSNDASVITGTTTGAVTEGNVGDAAETASGTLSVSDVDDDDNPGFADVAATAGDNAYGSFVLSGGTWTYTLDQSAVQDLDAGETVTDTITYTATDSTTQQITITITGTDDAAVVAGTVVGAVTEGDIGDAAVTATGSLSISDVDGDDTPGFADIVATSGDNNYGSFVLSSGTWTYTLDQSAVQGLDAGETVTDTITYTATDSTTQQITITITGTDDAAVVAGTVVGAVTEGDIGDAAETATGSLSISDVDGDDTPGFADVVATSGDNNYGSFVLSSGTWTYTLDQSAVQDLDAGDSVTDTITYTATDSTTQQITITITGTDDAAVVAGTVVGAVTEGDIGDAAETATGSLSISDVDGDDTPGFADVVATSGDNNYGSFVLSSGTWTYTLDQSAVQDLDAGDSATDTITYTATDSTTQQITITITGTDDAAVVAGTVVGAVTEGDIGDAAVTATGSLSISDVDGDDTPGFADVVATSGDNNYGSFVLSSGTWTYTLDQSAVQGLDAGETVTDTITYTATDSTTQQITITITGTDDAAVVAGTVVGAVTEGDIGDAAETATGSLSISDVDGDDTPSFADVVATAGDNNYGTFVLSSGTWTYTLDQSAVQNLDAGDSATDTITYTATDSTTQQITITITGTDDAAVVAGTVVGAVTEGDIGDAAVTATGSLSISDVDGDDTPGFADVVATSGDNNYGSFVLSSGTWTYTLDQSAVQGLDAGETVTDTITYTATDSTTQQITITITGTDDAAVVAGTVVGAVTEGDIGDAAETATGTLSISDVDGDDTPGFADVVATAGDNNYGSFVLSSGTWTYTLDQSAVQDLDAGDSVTDTITYTASDGTSQQVTVTIAGSNDASVITGTTIGAVTEGNVGDAAETASGTLSVSDVDDDDNPGFADVAATAGDNAYGSFVLSGGTWTYTLDQNTVQELDAGDSVTDTITFTAPDGETQQVTVTIAGSGDASVIAGTTTGTVTEGNVGDAAETASGALIVSDVDDDDNPSFADVATTAGDNAYGFFVLTSGTWTYTLDQNTVQELDAGDSVTDTFTFTASDGASQQVTVTIAGSNDASVITGTTTGAITEGNVGDAAETASGTLSVSDIDDDDNPGFADVAATAGDNAYGSFVLSGGTWTYTLDQSAVQNLDAGETVTDTITYTATDSTTQQITITITGTDDAAVVAGTVVGAVTEGNIGDAAMTATGTLSISDVDGDDTPGFADVVATAGDNNYGSFVLSSGTWTYTPDQSAVQDLDAGDSATDTITYTATDSTTQQITITITGTDDAAVVAGTVVGAVTEGNIGDAAVTATGTLSISDVDGDDTPGFADVVATAGDNNYGSFVLSSGTWTYTLDQSAVQDLDAGDSVTDTITYTASDSTMQQITITVSGTDDAAVVTGTTTGSVAEGNIGDAAETATGTLSISDVDGDDTPSFADVVATAGDNNYGSFVLNSGTWTYTLDQSVVQDLDAGDSVTDTITYTASDGTSQQVTVTIAGSNDASVITGTTTGAVTEGNVGDAAETASGTLSVSDVDDDDNPGFADVAATAGDNAYGSFVLSGGTWTYTLDQSAVQDLDAGDSVTDTITFTASDGTSQQVTVTIAGSNDASVITGTTTGAVTEGNVGDAAETASGTLSVSDVDDDDNPGFADVAATAGDNAYGSFVLSGGTWTYMLDQSAVQDLDAGEIVTDTITYTATDSTTQQITITITGTDDAAVVAGTVVGAVTEGNISDAAVTATGSLSISDVDGDDTPGFADVVATAGDNNYGSFVLSSGTWTYTLDQSAVQELDAGDSVTDTITYTASDGASQQVTVTIAGSNDASVISGTTTGAVTEGNVGDAAETASGTLSVSDIDDDDNPSFADVAATAGDNAYGSFVFTGGTWTYTLDQSAVQELDAGDSVTDTITFTAPDGETQQVTVTIAGSNDASVITGTTTGAVTEGNVGDAAETASGTLSISDIDDDDNPSFADVAATAGDNAYGSFVLTGGTWTYTLDQSAVQDLDAGDSVTDTITFTAPDGETQQVTVTITGSNDASVISGTTTGAVTEGNVGDAAETASGTLIVSDVDDDDTPGFADVSTTLGENAYGAFELSGGTWTYTLDQATVQALIAGDNVTDTITYTASDGTSQQITVMIAGSNDASVVNFGTAALVYTENASAVPVSSGLTVSDADSANLTGAVVRITGNYVDGEDELAFVTLGAISGSFISATGTLTLTGTASVSDYQTALRSISYENTSEAPTVGTRAVSLTVNDGSIDSSVATRDIVIVSVNDAPTITSDGAGTAASISVDENQSAVTTVTATDLDADGALTYSLGGKDASAFNIDSASGILTFNSAPDYEANATYEVDVIVTDNGITPLSDRQTLTVTVIDVDDDLRVAEDLLSAREDSPLLFDPVVELLANDFDPKGGALKLQSFGQPVNGTISETSSGLLEYQPNADFNGLDYFDYTVEDEAGNSATARVSIDVEAVNDPPVLLPESVDGPGATPGVNIDAVEASDGNVNIVENATVAGQVLAIDADGDVFTFSLEGPDAGLFEINSSTGELRPLAPLDFETPLDIDGDNQYELEILVTDSNGEQNRVALGVTTVNTNEPPQLMESRFVLEEGFSGELGRLSAIDVDAGDELVFELSSTGATLSGVNLLTDGRLITDGLLPGSYELEVLVRDSGNLVSIGYIVLQVNPLADAEPQLEAAVSEASRFTPTLSPATHYVNTSIKYVPVVSESVPDSSPYSVALFTSPPVFEVPPLQFSEPLGEQEWTPVATDFLRLMVVFIDRSFDLYEVQTTSSPSEAANWSFTPTSEQMMKMIEQIRSAIDDMQDQERDAERMMSLLVSFGTVTLSVSFAVWLLTSRILLAAAFSTSSLWRTVDPVPVLLGGRDKEEEEDEVDDDNGPDDSLDDLSHRVSNG